MTSDTRTDVLLVVASVGLAAGGLILGQASPLALFAVVPCLAFGATMVAWRHSPDTSHAIAVLVAACFLRMLLGPIGVAALLLVPVIARRADPEHANHLTAAAVGVHLAVSASGQLAVVIGEGFPTLAHVTPGEAVAGLALFVPFVVAGARD